MRRRPDADPSEDPMLVAYVVQRQGGYAVSHGDRLTEEKLLKWLGGQIPDYMVPQAVILLEALPLTANGKVAKDALPAPEEGSSKGDEYVAPRTETEKQLATIWAEVLKSERIGITDNFLALGGHSLLAIRVLGRISRSFGVRLPLRTLFDAPTVEQLSQRIDAERAAAPVAAPEKGLISRSREAYRVGRTTTPGSGTEPDA
jgi:acyl carrier protein